MKKIVAVTVAALMFGAPVAYAESVVGTWLTGPDKKGQVAHIVVSPCGGAFCGQITKTYDKGGKLIKGPNDGKKVLWDMKAAKADNYEGKLLLPLYGKTIKGKLQVKGKKLTVKGCMGPICQSQKWTKLN